jgi:hypothetical protein
MSRARWSVRAGDGPRIADVLARMGDPRAAEEGRAFVGGHRVGPTDVVHAGDVVEIWAARGAASGEDATRVLARRGGLVVAYKPAAIPTTADRRGVRSLVSDLEALLGEAPHPASRLGVGVGGAVVCSARSARWRNDTSRP